MAISKKKRWKNELHNVTNTVEKKCTKEMRPVICLDKENNYKLYRNVFNNKCLAENAGCKNYKPYNLDRPVNGDPSKWFRK